MPPVPDRVPPRLHPALPGLLSHILRVEHEASPGEEAAAGLGPLRRRVRLHRLGAMGILAAKGAGVRGGRAMRRRGARPRISQEETRLLDRLRLAVRVLPSPLRACGRAAPDTERHVRRATPTAGGRGKPVAEPG